MFRSSDKQKKWKIRSNSQFSDFRTFRVYYKGHHNAILNDSEHL